MWCEILNQLGLGQRGQDVSLTLADTGFEGLVSSWVLSVALCCCIMVFI